MLDKERELVNEEFIKDDSNYNLIVGGTGSYSQLHGNNGTNSKLVELNSKPWIWICNPHDGIKTRSWNLTLSEEQIKSGWEYGTLSKANFIQVEYNGEKMSLKMLSCKFNLDANLMIQRYKEKWTLEEMLSIPEHLGLHKTKEQHELAKTLQEEQAKKRSQETRQKTKELRLKQQAIAAQQHYAEFMNIGIKNFQKNMIADSDIIYMHCFETIFQNISYSINAAIKTKSA